MAQVNPVCDCEFKGQNRPVQFHHMSCYIWNLAGCFDGFFISAAHIDKHHTIFNLCKEILLDKEEE